MSARAIRKLREDRETAQKLDLNDVDEEDEDEEEEEEKPSTGGAFLAMMDSSEEEDEESDEEVDDDSIHAVEPQEKEATPSQSVARAPQPPTSSDTAENEEEDIDAILAEFQDEIRQDGLKEEVESESPFATITKGLEVRDLDLEYVQRTNLMGGSENDSSRPTRVRQGFLFGAAREGWGRPPHYVGGGVGMTSYDQHPSPLPWPYNTSQDPAVNNPQCWFSFQYSDTFQSTLEQYREIQQTGNVNALCLFVADNPFIPEALLQLAKVVYQTNNSAEGLALLRRCLYVYECASLKSFTATRGSCFLDADLAENATFFQSLSLLIQVSSIAGCTRTALSASRYMLALDPMRDTKGVLLTLDYFALSTMAHDYFVVDLVESKCLAISYKDQESTEFTTDLTGMPNWAYSYALALYRLENSGAKSDSSEDEPMTCQRALVSAIRKFPAVIEELLRKNDVSMSGRSTRTDWPPILEKLRQLSSPPSRASNYDPIVYHASKSAADLIIKVFIQRAFKLWSGSDVQKWMYDACVEATTTPSDDDPNVVCPSPALQRYARIDLADYEDRFRVLPQEANPLDPGLMQFALNVDPNRRRLLRRAGNNRPFEMDAIEALEHRARLAAEQGGIILGGPPTNLIDPDSPLMEVLLQSFLPWNHVEGVPPPRR